MGTQKSVVSPERFAAKIVVLGNRAEPIESTTEGIDCMNAPDQVLLDKIKQLPLLRVAQLEDFVDFLLGREADQRLTRAAGEVSEGSFMRVWNKDGDSACDRI